MRYTVCNECPCLNNDCEHGSSCNLGYNTGYISLMLNDWTDCSRDCGLRDVTWVINNDDGGRSGRYFNPKTIHDMPKEQPVYHKYWETDTQRTLNKWLREMWADKLTTEFKFIKRLHRQDD